MAALKRTLAVALLAGLAACDEGPQQPAPPKAGAGGKFKAESLPVPDDPTLARGRAVWAGTCQPCHGTGLGGAPRITDRAAWGPRIAQGTDVLFGHAMNGFNGKKGEMPARGGNDKLSNDEIKAAVAFMISLSK